MKHLRVIMLMCVTSMMLCACHKYKGGPPYITLANFSDIDISIQTSYPENKQEDSMILCHYGLRYGVEDLKADSLTRFFYWGWDDCYRNAAGWYDYFETSKYIQYLIMDRDTFWKYHSEPCDTIRKYVPVLHVYRLTLEDLERMNWTVVYPPEEED